MGGSTTSPRIGLTSPPTPAVNRSSVVFLPESVSKALTDALDVLRQRLHFYFIGERIFPAMALTRRQEIPSKIADWR